MRLTELSYDEWLEHAFGPEVRASGNAWFFDLESHWWAPSSDVYVAYLTRLFENPDPLVEQFADRQIAQGLTYLVDVSAVGDDGHLADATVPVGDRLRLIHSTAVLFERLFARQCTPHLSHLDEAGAGVLNGRCYMWWDTFPSVGMLGDPDLEALHRALLQAMERILKVGNIACQESALHGLGHWHYLQKEQVGSIIDGFIADNPGVRPELLTYARSARCGCIL
jgi:hypothetical protein